MEFKQLECFVAVARKKSFSSAGDVLLLSQPAVTSNIQNLEKEFDVLLFDRNKEVTLTKAGKKFYPYALEMLNIRDKSMMAIDQHKNNIEGVLEICTSTIPEQHLLPHIIKAFKKIYPKVKFSLRHKDSQEVVEEILSGISNFGFVGAKYFHKGIKYIDFFEDRLVVIASAKKTFTSEVIGIEDLLGEEILLREEGSGTRKLIENALKEKGLDLDLFSSQIISHSLEAIKNMVALNIGISFASEVSVKDQVASGRIKQYEVKDLNLNRHFSLAYSEARYLFPVEEKFKEFVSEWRWDRADL